MGARNLAKLGIVACFLPGCGGDREATSDDATVSTSSLTKHRSRPMHHGRRGHHCPGSDGNGTAGTGGIGTGGIGTGGTGTGGTGTGGAPQCPGGNAWSRGYGTSGQFQNAKEVAIDASDSAIVVGTYGTTIQFG